MKQNAFDESQVPTIEGMRKMIDSDRVEGKEALQLLNLFENGARSVMMNADGQKYTTDVTFRDGLSKRFVREIAKDAPKSKPSIFGSLKNIFRRSGER